MPDSEPVHLPRAENAWIPEAKLRDYALDPDHEVGRHKARVFRAALGLRRSDWVVLRDQILAQVGRIPVSRSHPEPPDTIRYTVVIPITGPNGETRDVITAWFVRGSDPPQLASVYVSARRSR